MKTNIVMFVIAIASLTTGLAQNTNKTYEDDIYYSSKDAAADKQKLQIQKQREQEEASARKKEDERNASQNKANTTTSDNDDYYQSPSSKANTSSDADNSSTTSNSSATSNSSSFDYDDYYDYEYAVRLKRFHNSIPAYGYYDNFYTNSYWYTGNPYNYGTSVYMGYNFWGPTYYTYSYYPSYTWYSSWGWGYDPWYNPYSYNPYAYNPYFYNPYGYYSYWNPYHCYTNNYFNSYDRNSYYGPRNSATASGRRGSEPTMAHRYMNAVERETQKPFNETRGRGNNPYMNTTRPTNQVNTGTVDPGKHTNEPRRGNHSNTPDGQNNNAGNNHNSGNIDPGKQIEVKEPRRGTHLETPNVQNNHNTGNIDPGKQTEVKQPRRSQRPLNQDDGKQGNLNNNNNSGAGNPNGGSNEVRDPEIKTTQPDQRPIRNTDIQPRNNGYEQPSRQIEPSRSPQFEQPRNSGSQTAPRDGSSSPSVNRPRR